MQHEFDPFTEREAYSQFMPKWLVSFFGPYSDEVGVLPYIVQLLAKVVVVAGFSRFVIRLFVSEAVVHQLGKGLVICGVAAVLIAAMSPDSQ